MDALPPANGTDRPEARMPVARQVGQTWLEGQGARHGFTPDQVSVADYSVRRLSRGSGRSAPVTFGVLDMTGLLQVHDPDIFLAALVRGFGRAKAFGCGLMLIRRA